VPALPLTRPHRLLVSATVITVLVDIASKVWAVRVLNDRDMEIGGSLSLRLAYNDGVAFSIGRTLPTWLLLLATFAVAAALLVAGWRGALVPPVVVGLLVGGAIANFLDRLVGGSVVDMIYLSWWPTFNLADVAITTGAIALVVYSMLFDRRDPGGEAPATGESS